MNSELTIIRSVKLRIRLLLSVAAVLPLLSGCKSPSSVPTESDNFILIPPTDLQVLYAQDASVLVVWNPVTAVGFSYYNVYMGPSRTQERFAGQTTDNGFFVDSLSYDSTYFFSVTAVYANGAESTPSNSASAEPVNYSAPPAPFGLTVRGHNDDFGKYISVIWSSDPAGDLGGYEVYRDTTGDFVPDTIGHRNLVATLTANSFRDTTGLVTGQEYYYQVIAFDFAHWRSAPSAVSSDMVLARPVLVSPPEGTSINYSDFLTFKFGRVQGASGYILSISLSPGGAEVYSTTIPADQDSLLYSGSSLNFNQLYFWRVGATTVDPNTPNSLSSVSSFTITQ